MKILVAGALVMVGLYIGMFLAAEAAFNTFLRSGVTNVSLNVPKSGLQGEINAPQLQNAVSVQGQ